MAGVKVGNRAGATNWFVVAIAVFAAGASVAGCSQVTEYQSSYPTVLAPPPPRADQPMSADELKQATDALISDRSQLNAEAQSAQQQASPPATTGTARHAGASSGQ